MPLAWKKTEISIGSTLDQRVWCDWTGTVISPKKALNQNAGDAFCIGRQWNVD